MINKNNNCCLSCQEEKNCASKNKDKDTCTCTCVCEPTELPEPECVILNEICEKTDELMDELECCDVDSGLGDFLLSEASKIELMKRMAGNLVEQSRCGNYRGMLVFNSCESMARYKGDALCPLKEGTLALVYDKATMCFELWVATLNPSGMNDVDCSDGQTYVSQCRGVIWKSYSKCHPDVFVTGNKLEISGNTITSTITRSDGKTFIDSVGIEDPTPTLKIAKIKLDSQSTISVPTGVDTPYMLIGSSTPAPVTGWYQMSGATAGEITNYNTVCTNPGDARAEAFYQFKVGSTMVGDKPFQSSYATNVVNDKELVIAGGAGFSVYLTAGQKIDVYVSHRKHESAHCTATHNVYLEGVTYGLE